MSDYIWLCLTISGYVLLSLVSLIISDHLYQVSSIVVKLEAGDSKLLLFETFPGFFLLLSRTSYRGARAPKKRAAKNSAASGQYSFKNVHVQSLISLCLCQIVLMLGWPLK